jgi:hypothetical protein
MKNSEKVVSPRLLRAIEELILVPFEPICLSKLRFRRDVVKDVKKCVIEKSLSTKPGRAKLRKV